MGWSQFHRELEGLSATRLRQQIFRHARRIELHGSFFYTPGKEIILHRRGYSEYEIFNDEFGVYASGMMLRDDTVETADMWNPLNSLLSKFDRLVDLVFSCYNSFPPALLEALHQHQPKCRLHVDTFNPTGVSFGEIAPHDMALMKSPCLYAVRVLLGGKNMQQRINLHAAVLYMSGGGAANLKHVHLCFDLDDHIVIEYETEEDEIEGDFYSYHPRLERLCVQKPNPGALVSLTIPQSNNLLCDLELWSQHTNFQKLRSLTLTIFSDTLHGILPNDQLTSLETLKLVFTDDTAQICTANIATFIDGLSRLSCLMLKGSMEMEHLEILLGLNSKALTVLDVEWLRTPTYGEIVWLREHCPLLELLTIDVKREKSDNCETKAYEKLGTFPRLRKLFLNLDYAPFDLYVGVQEETGDASWLEKARGGQYQQELAQFAESCFLNAAIDERLARDIWSILTSNNRHLECLQVISTFGRCPSYDIPPFYTFQNELLHPVARSFLLKKDTADGITAQELERRNYISSDYRKAWAKTLATFERGRPSVVKAVMQRLWPAMEGSQDWIGGWESLPLQRTGSG